MCEHLNGLQQRALEAYPSNAEVHCYFKNSNSMKLAQVGGPGTFSIFYVFTPIFMNKKNMDIIVC